MSGKPRGSAPDAGLKHPLMGARLGTLSAALRDAGPLDRGSRTVATLMLASALARLPFRPLEALQRARRSARAPAPEAPLFVIGHWRSGTTHLHNLLSCSPSFGHISPIASGLPDEVLTLGTWLQPSLERQLPDDRGVDRVAVRPDSPQEDEIPLANIQRLSIFHALYFPKRFHDHMRRGVYFEGCTSGEVERWQREVRAFAEKISLHQDRPRLVIKNPVYTARIALLRQIWPDAKFIHIRRNPYEVYVSTRSYFKKLLAQLALQRYDHIDLDEFVLTNFQDMMRRYEDQSGSLPPEDLIEVSYEELRERALTTLETIHRQLGLADWSATRPRVEAYLRSISGYRTNGYRVSSADAARVEKAWGEYLERWRYARSDLPDRP